MSKRQIVCTVFVVVLNAAVFAQETAAREYYNELYKAGGLDRFTDQYACFRDDIIPTFFLLAKSDNLKQFLIESGEYKKIPEKSRSDLDKGFLMVTMYSKGIAGGREYFDKDSLRKVYFEEAEIGTPPKRYEIVLTVQWETLRYRRTVGGKGNLPAAFDTGKCEEVKPGIQQHGGE